MAQRTLYVKGGADRSAWKMVWEALGGAGQKGGQRVTRSLEPTWGPVQRHRIQKGPTAQPWPGALNPLARHPLACHTQSADPRMGPLGGSLYSGVLRSRAMSDSLGIPRCQHLWLHSNPATDCGAGSPGSWPGFQSPRASTLLESGSWERGLQGELPR